MHCILSDNREWVVVFGEDEEEPVELTVPEFISKYGKENLPYKFSSDEVLREDLKPHKESDVQDYWASFKTFVDACGKFAWANKINNKDMTGSFKAHEVVEKVFGYDGSRKLAIETNKRDVTQWGCVNNLNYWSQRVGFLPFSENDKCFLIEFLYDSDIRDSMKYRIKKYSKKGEAVSAKDLVIEILKRRRK